MGDEEVNADTWSCFAKFYDPLKIGSIDGTDTEPHDKGIIRSLNSEYKPNKHAKGKPECTIFVSRLSPKTTKDTIKDIFSKFGRLKRFRLVKDIVTGFPKGYAFIEYESEGAAEEAYRKAYKMNIDGHKIFVDFECERLLKGWKPRRLGGGFGGRKESGQLRFGCRDRPFRKPISLEIKEQEGRLKRDKELRAARELERDDRRRRDRDYNRKRSPEGAGGKRKRSRSADRDRKRSRSKERRASTTEKRLGDHHLSRTSKSETNSEQGSKEKIKKSSEGVNKKKRSRSGDRSRRSSRSGDRSRSSRSKDKRTNTEKKSGENDENHQMRAIKVEDQNTNDKIDVTCKEEAELKPKDNEQSNESKLENTSGT